MSNNTKSIKNIGQLIQRIRISLLVKKGLKLGRNVYIDFNVRFDGGFCHLISVGDDCTLTHGVKILAHDASMIRHIKYVKVGRVTIGRKTFIGYDSIILPNVRIGENVIIGAGSVVTTDIPDNSVAVGCPAKVIRTITDFLREQEKNLEQKPIYIIKTMNDEQKQSMYQGLRDTFGYIRRA